MKLCAIGCGEHAESSHGPSQARYAAAHPELTLAACCDLDAARAERHRVRFGFARAYSDPWAMLDAEAPDAVVLVVPDTVTCGLACRILERGLPLLLEKPPGRTVEEADRMIAAAAAGGRTVPHQVAFNRRYAPLVRALRQRIEAIEASSPVQHVRYEMARVDRRDPDFSTTAIHGIDAVRYLAASDYAEVRFRYQALPDLGAGVANIFMDCVMASGATAHLGFCPVAGVVVERAAVHARDHTLFLEVPMWGALDHPGRLQHLERGRLVGEERGDPQTPPFEAGGFAAELEAFVRDVTAGRAPSPSLRETRQSVEVAEHIRHRRDEYRP